MINAFFLLRWLYCLANTQPHNMRIAFDSSHIVPT
jgi:hypothetical protein